MRLGVYALLMFFVSCEFVIAQTPPSPSVPAETGQDQQSTGQPVLTPTQQREKQIREYDPLDQSDNVGDKVSREVEKQRRQNQTPTPGSIAATDQENATKRPGPQVIDDTGADAPVQEYTGPAVLSRTYSVDRPMIPQQLKWQESLGLSNIYDTGVTKQVTADGSLGASSPLTGIQLTGTFAGRRYFHRDQVSVSYSGNLSQYSGVGGYNGSNQSIAADYSHVVSRHISVNLSATGSLLSQNSILSNPVVGPESVANINLASSPNIQIYDTGAKQFSPQVDVIWQKSYRLSFSAGASYFAIIRSSPLLLGTSGEQARGDVNYRLTRKMTVGAYYSFSHYVYPHGFGNSDINTVGLIYSYALSRTLQVRFRGGVSRIESLGLETVQIDPAIAVLLGRSSGTIDAYLVRRTSDISAQVVKDFRGGSTLSLSYASGVSPGNGVFQTSEQTSISANFSAKVLRTYTIQAGIGRDTLVAATQNLGNYQSEYGRIALARVYRRGIGLSLTADYRHFDLALPTSVRSQVRVTSGITWSPGSGRLWPF
jgi:hypothetical protein